MENVVKLPFSKPLHFKTYRPKERTLNSSYATSYKSKNLFDNILSPENQTRSLHNRLENAQKRIENIENDQKSVKRLLTSLKGGSDDLITEENLYLIEKVKVPKGTKQVIDDSFLENPPPEIEESHFRKETLREILLKMNMFKKTYSCKSNLERIFEHIRKKIEKNFGFYYDFLNENNIQHLKVFIQILYDAIDNLILSYSSVSSHQNFQKTSFEQKIRDLNEAILEKMDLLENLQNEKNLLNRTFIFHQKVIEEIALQVQSMKESSLFPLDKLKLLLKDYKTMDISKEYKSLDDYRSLEAYKEDFIESKDADQIKMKLQTEALEEEIRKYKDLLIEKNQRNEESQQLKNGLQEYKKKFEIKEQEVKNLQKTLEDTRKEISGLSKDLILNSKDKEDFLMKITDDNEALLRKKDDLSKKNEILIKENKLLERKFEEQLVIFKGDLQ